MAHFEEIFDLQEMRNRPSVYNESACELIGLMLGHMELQDGEECAHIMSRQAGKILRQNEFWRTGGHGHECECQQCKEIFQANKCFRDGYKEFLAQTMTREKDLSREENNYRMYSEQPQITERMMKSHMVTDRYILDQTRKWVKDNHVYKLKSPLHIYADSGVPEIGCVIIDESGLYTHSQAAEYYMSLKGEHPHKKGKYQRQMMTPCEDTLAQTLVIDAEGFDILGDKEEDKKMQVKLAYAITVLSLMHSQANQGDRKSVV